MALQQQIGAAIREARTARGWSQMRLALEAGIQTPAISRLETGVSGVQLATLDRLLAALGLRCELKTGIEAPH